MEIKDEKIVRNEKGRSELNMYSNNIVSCFISINSSSADNDLHAHADGVSIKPRMVKSIEVMTAPSRGIY